VKTTGRKLCSKVNICGGKGCDIHVCSASGCSGCSSMALAVVAGGTLLSVQSQIAQVAVPLSKGLAVWPRWLVGMAQQIFLQFLKIKAIRLLLLLAITLLCCTQILQILQGEFLYLCNPFGIENFLLGKNT